MKKVLFATTALVATAGVAAADINFSGYGRFGVTYNSTTKVSAVTSRLRLTVDGSTEADNGLSFGARLRFEQNNGNAAQGFNAARFYAKAGSLEVGVGNIYGAMDSLPGIYSGSVGLTGLGWGNVVTGFATHTYSSSGAGSAPNGVELIYSAGNFTAHISNAAKRTEIAGSFNMNDWTVGLGFAQIPAATAGTQAVMTVGGKLGAASVGLAVAQNVSAANVKTTRATLSGSFEVGAGTTVTAYIAQNKAAASPNNYGLGVSHSLGGGASLKAGVASVGGTTLADLGVLFNF